MGRLSLASACGAAFLWGTGALVVNLLIVRHGFSPETISFWRFAVGAAVLLVLFGRPALWRAVREHHPMLARRMVFVTGDTLSPGARQFLDETGCRRLDKPFSRVDLLAQVNHALRPETAHD